MAKKTIRPVDVEQQPARIDRLRLARISDTGALSDLHDQSSRAWELAPEVPRREWLQQIGGEALQSPQVVNGEHFRHGNTRAVLFAVPDTNEWALYCLGSAASSEDALAGDNAFVQLLTQVLEQLQPETLLVPTFDRLIRSLDHFSPLWRAFKAHIDELRSSVEVIGVHEPNAEARFMLAALSASQEAAATRDRTFTGRRQQLERDCTILGAASIPPGYQRLENRDVVPDPAQRPVVEAILHGMATGQSDRDIIAAAAAAGGTSPKLQHLHGSEATYLDHTNPAELARGWYATLELWHTGVREQTLQVPPEHRGRSMNGLPVVRDEDGHDYLVAPQQWGLPEGGWASDEVFDAAYTARERRRARNRPTGGASQGRRRPLGGLVDFLERDGDTLWHYQLFCDQQGVYELRRRQLTDPSEQTRGWGRRPHLDGERVAQISVELLHRTLADDIVALLEHGVPLEWLDGYRAWRDGNTLRAVVADEPARATQRTLDRKRGEVDNLLATTRHAHTPAAQQQLAVRLDTLHTEITELEAELARLLDTQHAPATPEEFESELGYLTACLAVLRHTTGPADRDLGDALATILEDLRLHLDGDRIAWTGYVRIPANGGVARARVHGQLAVGTRRTATSVAAQRPRMLEAFMTEGLDLPALAARFGKTSLELVANALLRELAVHGLTRRAREFLVRFTPSPAREVIWASLHRQPLPPDLDTAYAHLVIDTYLGDGPIGAAQAIRITQPRHQQICDYLAHRGGTARRDQLLTDLAPRGITPTHLNSALTHRIEKGKRLRNRPRAIQPCPHNPATHVALITCPHCHHWAETVSRLPEVPDGLLCPHCHRMPRPNSPIYPTHYHQALKTNEKGHG